MGGHSLLGSRASSSREETSGTIVDDGDAELRRRHEQFIMEYGRVYSDENEKEKRFQIFKKNVVYIDAFNNSDENTFELAVNKFADLSDEEFKATYLGCRKDNVPLGHCGSTKEGSNSNPTA